MATTEKNISVNGTFKLKIGETEIALTREEADRLYGELYKALGKLPSWVVAYDPFGNPRIVPEQPRYVPAYYRVGDFPPYTVVTCDGTNPTSRMGYTRW